MLFLILNVRMEGSPVIHKIRHFLQRLISLRDLPFLIKMISHFFDCLREVLEHCFINFPTKAAHSGLQYSYAKDLEPRVEGEHWEIVVSELL